MSSHVFDLPTVANRKQSAHSAKAFTDAASKNKPKAKVVMIAPTVSA